MKNKQALFSLLVTMATVLAAIPVLASTELSVDATASGASAQENAANKKKKKSTEVSFDDVLVQGKYHFSDEAVTTVEQDKVLDALLGVRTDFKDRLKKSAARR